MASSKKVGGKVIHLRESVGTNGEAKNFAKDTTSFRTASLLKSCCSKWLQLFTNLFFVILCQFVFVVH